MALYKVGVQFSIYGYIEIEAASKEEAYNIANREDNEYTTSDVKDQDYLVNSWQADKENISICE